MVSCWNPTTQNTFGKDIEACQYNPSGLIHQSPEGFMPACIFVPLEGTLTSESYLIQTMIAAMHDDLEYIAKGKQTVCYVWGSVPFRHEDGGIWFTFSVPLYQRGDEYRLKVAIAELAKRLEVVEQENMK